MFPDAIGIKMRKVDRIDGSFLHLDSLALTISEVPEREHPRNRLKGSSSPCFRWRNRPD